jgi:hypothetical protein
LLIILLTKSLSLLSVLSLSLPLLLLLLGANFLRSFLDGDLILSVSGGVDESVDTENTPNEGLGA